MSRIQDLLDQDARLGNDGLDKQHPFRVILIEEIKALRGVTSPPACWGQDDCSTAVLVQCPWRIDCGS